MTDKERMLQLLGLMQVSGNLESGEEQIFNQLSSGRILAIVFASDVSQNTRKKILDKCTYYNIPYFDLFTKAEISHSIGRSRSVCGIINEGFYHKFNELNRTEN